MEFFGKLVGIILVIIVLFVALHLFFSTTSPAIREFFGMTDTGVPIESNDYATIRSITVDGDDKTRLPLYNTEIFKDWKLDNLPGVDPKDKQLMLTATLDKSIECEKLQNQFVVYEEECEITCSGAANEEKDWKETSKVKVTLECNPCTDDLNTVSITITGVEDTKFGKEYAVYFNEKALETQVSCKTNKKTEQPVPLNPDTALFGFKT